MKKIYSLMLGAGCLLGFNSCTYNKEKITPNINTCGPIPATYSGTIKSLIKTNCAIPTCHDQASASGGMVFENYDQVKANIDRVNQRAIVERTMPATGPLNTTDYNNLKCWIDNGAKND